MKIHEYQAKSILARFGVPVPKGEVAFNADDARAAAERLGGGTVVVKAQIHAGGRGKGGGVKVVKGAQAAFDTASHILGMRLVTHQTGPDGRIVSRVLVEQGLAIARELYLGLLIDRTTRKPILMVSQDGGMEIETVAEKLAYRLLAETGDAVIGDLQLAARAANRIGKHEMAASLIEIAHAAERLWAAGWGVR